MNHWVKGIVVALAFMAAGLTAVQGSRQMQPASSAFDVTQIRADEFFQAEQGSFVLKNLETGNMYIYNEERAKERRPPQSTFKIMNALIGLQVKAVKDEYDIKYWDGITRALPVWNQDHTLGSAMRNSVVWYYQAMARDIGGQRMQEWIDGASYGNRDISGGIDQFWLSSSLAISPLEQVEFLEKLYKETLPFDKKVMKTVKRIMIQQEGDHYTLYGKTGSTEWRNGSAMGWFVGFITVDGHPYAFAANMDTPAEFGGPRAKDITIQILRKYGLLGE